jgi:hypothetical protein
VQVTDNAGATSVLSVTVAVAPRPSLPPVAALAVTPSVGTAPLTVTASAATSSNLDDPIVSYTFDFGDGTVLGPQSSATATHTYAAGQWRASVKGRGQHRALEHGDGGRRRGTGSSPNLVANSSFETGIAGWSAVGKADLSAHAGGYEGGGSLEVSATKPNSKEFGVTDDPDCVASVPVAGTAFRFTAWVQDEGGADWCQIRVRERQSYQSSDWAESAPVQLSSEWKLVQLDYRALSEGSSLDSRSSRGERQ